MIPIGESGARCMVISKNPTAHQYKRNLRSTKINYEAHTALPIIRSRTNDIISEHQMQLQNCG